MKEYATMTCDNANGRQGDAGMTWAERINPTVRRMPESSLRCFMDAVAQTTGAISLCVGEPDFVTPQPIREACVQALADGRTSYTSSYGLLALRQAICRDVERRYGVAYDPDGEALVTVGVSEGMDLALRAIIGPGDEVLIPEPCYVSYLPCVMLTGGVPVAVPTDIGTNFRVTPSLLERYVTPRTKALLLSYPNNPTGAVLTRAEMLALAEFAARYDLIVISDEIYDKLTYKGQHTCFASLPGMRDRTILLNGFSKAYAMTGWRIGYALANKEFIAAMLKIHQYTIFCAPITAQMAALTALAAGEDAMRGMVAEYDRRRRLMVDGLRRIGLPCFEPQGAFYIFPSIRETGLSSQAFAEQLLAREKVAVTPGSAFGACGEGYVRCSYAASEENLVEALRRLERFVNGHRR